MEKKNCKVYSINGVGDHLHIIFSLHPSIALADLVKDIKLATTKLIREKELFPDFGGWQTGYAAFTYQIKACKGLVRYVENQETHHNKKSYENELDVLLLNHQISYERKDL